MSLSGGGEAARRNQVGELRKRERRRRVDGMVWYGLVEKRNSKELFFIFRRMSSILLYSRVF